MGDVVVTQADRLKSATTQDFYHRITQVDYDAILNGEWDHEECVIMEARHRIASHRPLLEALEKVLPWIGKIPFGMESVVKVDNAIADTLAAIKQAKGE